MKGVINLRVWRRGKILWECDRPNLVVSASLVPRAKLLGGDTANQAVSVVGFGSGSAAPAAGDTDFGAEPAYYKAIDSHSYPATPGQVQFDWSLVPADTGAFGMTITEIALFANTGAVALPVARAIGAGAPSVTMMAHALLPASIAFTSGMTVSGTWTLSA